MRDDCMNEKVKKIIEKHIASDLIIESVAMTTDFKTHNKEMKNLRKLLEITSQDKELCNKVYSQLLVNENVVTLLNSASECLQLNIFINESINILKSLSKRKDVGIISFNAEMMLKEYQKKCKDKRTI